MLNKYTRSTTGILQFKLILYITPSRPGESAEHSQSEEEPSPTNKESQNTVQEQNEKRLRGLKKKIQQIEKLKIKQEEGEALEDSQVIYNDQGKNMNSSKISPHYCMESLNCFKNNA